MSVEKYSNLSRFGRRRLLQTGLAASAAGVILFAAKRLGLVSEIEPRNQNLVIPSSLTGIIPNCHHLPYIENSEIQEGLNKNIDMIGPICTRVFLDDQFEPRPGDYQQAPLDKIAKLSRRRALAVDLFDAYTALHSSKLSSPYLVPKQGRDIRDQQWAIFTDPDIRQTLANRLKVAVQALKGEPGIKAWCVANELNLRVNDISLMRDLHTDLFQQLVEEILSVDSSRPIFIGIDDPNLIIEERFTQYRTPIINTIHVYPWPSHLKMVYDYRGKEEHYLPLACQEIGYPRAQLGNVRSVKVTPDYDRVLSQFSIQIFNGLSSQDFEEGTTPFISSWGPWRISAEGDTHNDGFEIMPDKMPESLATFNHIRESLIAA